MGKPLIDRIGQRYTRLRVIARVDNYRGNAQWKCLCDCGKTVIALGNDLQRGKVKSCGCLNAERILKHGHSYDPVYRVWLAMRQRCENPQAQAYRHYGGRGIKVCKRWQKFENFVADMGPCPPGRTLDRIDNNGPYSPQNCRWATYWQQINNSRRNRVIEYNGESHTLSQWARITGIKSRTIRSRIDDYGWSIEKALTTPIQPRAR